MELKSLLIVLWQAGLSLQQTWPPTSRFCCELVSPATPGFQQGKRPLNCPSFNPCYTEDLDQATTQEELFRIMSDSVLLPLFRQQLLICPDYPNPSTSTGIKYPVFAEAFVEDCRSFSYLAITYPDTIYNVNPIRTLDVTEYTVCKYVVDFSSVKKPLSITKVYFNERIQEDAKEHLELPVTEQYFDPVKHGSSQGYFAFPYFVIVRGLCEDGEFFGQEVYHQIAYNSAPKITFTYFPKTGRAVYENALKLTTESAIVSLVQDKEKVLSPDPNYTRLKNKDGSSVCSDKNCNPAWICPFPFLHVPIVEISLTDKRSFSALKKQLYVNPFNARYAEGYGELEIAQEFLTLDGHNTRVSDVSPRYIFPKKRKYEYDTDLVNLGWLKESIFPYQEPITGQISWDKNTYIDYCFLPENRKIMFEFDIAPTFYFVGKEAELNWAIKELQKYRSHYPLTREDFVTPKYALGNTPTVMLAGFYRPDLLIVGNPDMNRIEIIQWEYDNHLQNDKNIFGLKPSNERPIAVTKDDFYYAPDQELQPRQEGPNNRQEGPIYGKPVFSYRDSDLRGTVYGRRAYYPLNYSSSSVKCVFDVLNFEDRVILKTVNGLVTLYGNTNASIALERNLLAPINERLNGAFKILRMNQVALGEYDPVVAVSYGDEAKKIPQKIYYTRVGGALENATGWTEIGRNEYIDSATNAPTHALPELSHSPKQSLSEAIKICSLVFNKHIISLFPTGEARYMGVFRPTDATDPDKCVILDAVPIPIYPSKILVLVQMTFKYYKNLECNAESSKAEPPLSPSVDCDFNRRKCLRFLYCKQKYKSSSTPKPNPPSPPLSQTHPYLACKPKYGSWLAGHYNQSFPWNRNYHASLDEIKHGLIYDLNERYTTGTTSTEYLTVDGSPTTWDYDGDLNINYDDQKMCEEYDNTHFEINTPGATKRIWENKKYKEFDAAFQSKDEKTKTEILNHFCDFRLQRIPLYILAEHDVKKVVSSGGPWKIVNIYPEIPCEVEHLEAVKTMSPFGPAYFQVTSEDSFLTCYEKYTGYTADRVDITGFTFTRQVNNHLYMYGTRLYHSPDGGRTLQVYRDFPLKPRIYNPLDFDMSEIINMNRIKQMAFSSKGQFAFLTAKRELWVGNTGTDRLIRVRPSDGWSMMNLKIYKYHKGVESAIPFSVFYDSQDKLLELVALRDSEGHVAQILKRSITEHFIFRNEVLVDNLHNVVNEQISKQISVCFKEFPLPSPFRCPTTEEPVEPISSMYPKTADATILPIVYSILDLAVYCPFSQMKVKQNYSKTLNRLQQFHITSPIQHPGLGHNFTVEALMAFSVGTFQIVYDAYLRLDKTEYYSRIKPDPFDKWKKHKKQQLFTGLVNFYRREPEAYGIFVDPRLTVRNIDVKDAASKRFIRTMWLNYNQTVEISFSFFLKNANLLSKTDFLRQKLTEIQINVDNGNKHIISVSSERTLEGHLGSVRFTTLLQVNRSSNLKQHHAGRGLAVVPITFHLINSLGRCHDLEHWGMVGESISCNILAGCQPATDLLFDWNTTLYSLQFRNPTLKYGDEDYCYKKAHVCFYAKEDIILNFDVLDLSKQIYVPYNGKYKLKVVGGGTDKETMQTFSETEVDAYNIPGKSDISLIWALSSLNEKNETMKDSETQETILEAGVTRIKWACNSLSPCAIISPKLNFRTVYYFKIKISNENVDPDTLCLHEREFIIMVYGFPPSPEILLIVSLICSVIIFFALHILYLCCRRQKTVWRASKLKIWGWIKIIIDTMPKLSKRRLSYYDEQARKDNILLSLQGHLRVPSVVFRKMEETPSVQSFGGRSSKSSDSYSIQSPSAKSTEILPEVRERPAAGTWTDMVYEQIISKRLISIIERNKRLRNEMEEHTAALVGEREKIAEKKKKKKGAKDKEHK